VKAGEDFGHRDLRQGETSVRACSAARHQQMAVRGLGLMADTVSVRAMAACQAASYTPSGKRDRPRPIQ
jgi:hypothetical protein